MNKNIIHPMALMALAAVLLMSTLAAAQTVAVNALSGDLVAKGVGVDVSVQISCTGISTPYANPTITSLTERFGKSLTNGGGQTFFEPITLRRQSPNVPRRCAGNGKRSPWLHGYKILPGFGPRGV
jgi:hypothetical protein